MLGIRGLPCSILFLLCGVSHSVHAFANSDLIPKPSDENVAGLVRFECGRDPFPDCGALVQELVSGKAESTSVIGVRRVADEIVEGLYEGKLYPNGRFNISSGQVEARASEDIGK